MNKNQNFCILLMKILFFINILVIKNSNNYYIIYIKKKKIYGINIIKQLNFFTLNSS